jgi:Aspartate/tyrosine/aromatic aminotransferase
MQNNDNAAPFNPESLMAERLGKVPFSGIRKVFDKVKELEAAGRDVIHWQIGRPDFDTPAHIKEAAIESLRKGEVHYAPNLGTPALRKAIGNRTTIDTGVKSKWRNPVHRHGGSQRRHHGFDARLHQSRRRSHHRQPQLAPLQILRFPGRRNSRRGGRQGIQRLCPRP